MLFTIKRYFLPALLLTSFFVTGSLLLRRLLDLSWSLSWVGLATLLAVLAGAGAVATSDALLHGLLWLVGGKRYLARYRALVHYFAPQNLPDIVAAGLLAMAEELFFRGILLQSLIERLGWSPLPALLLSSLLFALAHIIGRRDLAPFAFWAFWEGLLLGTVYLLSGSLLVSLLVHSFHDIGGFALFAFQRRTGWLLAELSPER
jgi:membrane protease YdiL (CAAX protease family)